MSKTYKEFVKEYAMGLQVPATSYLKPIASLNPLRRRKKVRKRKLVKKVRKLKKVSFQKSLVVNNVKLSEVITIIISDNTLE